MRFVDGEQADVQLRYELLETRRQQALRRHVQEVQRAGARLARDVARFVQRGGGIEAGRGHALFHQSGHLVLHQRDQRRHHDGDAWTHQRGDLETEAFAAAGGHQHQRVAALGNMIDNLPLLSAEFGIAEDIIE